MKILAIETSCDETSLALVEVKPRLLRQEGEQFKVLRNIISSQINIHRPYGGVVPMLAKREHHKNLPLIFRKILNSICPLADYKLKPDFIAVTVGPGLEPALWEGINFAKDLAKRIKKPVRGVSHLDGHLYSFLLSQKTVNSKIFPAIGLLVSGGHTILLLMKSLTKWKKLGETRDDAAGEAFDKVGRLLNLPYPGGPEIEKIAKKGNSQAINFPRPMLRGKNYEFSFSGLKTAVLYYLRDTKNINKADVAASFQQAVIDVLVGKTIRAAKEFKVKSVILCGGVAANQALRESLKSKIKKLKLNFLAPAAEFNTDNAAMIAAAAYINNKLKKKNYRLEAQPNLSI